MQKRAIAVHDISCVGRCSLTVALPILSAAGIETSIVPTALLSTHTGEFTGYTHLDLSDQLLPIAHHLSSLGRSYDAFYSGYLASGAQVDQVLGMMDLLCDESTHIFVDPAFGDHGRMYSLMDEAMPSQMRKLCSRARTIVPNLTEACFLLGKPYPKEGCTPELIAELCAGLLTLGPDNVVITDIAFSTEHTGLAIQSRHMPQPVYQFRSRFEGVFHGTGDVFASLLLAGLMNNRTVQDAAAMALELTHEAIAETLEDQQPLRYGVQFEKVLPKLWGKLK
ncbi:MAG: pyridoxamine kinase [Clostridia bacterium]|nr:pyridoxamine kinase [Clostridia bacterium]MBP3649337.1 pyridoxamine kinase [Clostridia bacterium]